MIAITGMGVVCALGTGRDKLLSGFLDTKTGVSAPVEFHEQGVGLLGEVKQFDYKKYIPALKARRMSRFSLLALTSAAEAVEDSALDMKSIDPFRAGVIVGTGLSSTHSTDYFYQGLVEGGPLNTNPMVFPETVQNIAASQTAIHFAIKGPNTTFSQNEISSELALKYGVGLLESNKADAVLVTGAEEISQATLMGLSALGILSKTSRMEPFGSQRDGIVLGEGSATVVIERAEDARARGAHVHALISSIEMASEPVDRLRYDKEGFSMKRAMAGALRAANVDKPDMLCAAANSTVDLDAAEALAIAEMFGKSVPVTAMRAYTGFFISDGLLRLAGAAMCMEQGIVPAVPGNGSGPESIDVVSGSPREQAVNTAMINSFSSGGTAACVVIEKP